MDYKVMWEELKTKIEADLAYYKDGRMCSMREQSSGMFHCEMMLKEMRAVEEKYSN